jgi:uncharacterized protein
MRGWSKTEHQEPGIRVAETGNGPAPILLIRERCTLLDSDLFPPLHEARTRPAFDDLSLYLCQSARHARDVRPPVRGLGTLINIGTVLVGGLVGLYAGHRFPDRIRLTIMQGIGLTTIAVAVVGFEPLLDPDRGLRRAVILIGALTLGAIVGEALRLEERLTSLGDRIQRRFGVEDSDALETDHESGDRSRFVEGFVVASTVFCVGPLTLLGAVEDGLGTSIRLLAIKSTLDGITAIGFASVYGWGALASLITIVVVQGAATLGATLLDPVLTSEVLAQLGVVGSLLVLGIGLRLLEIKEIRVVALSPALIFGPVVAGIVDRIV